MRPGPRPHPRLGPRAFISQPFVPIAHDCGVHFHPARDCDHAPAPAPDHDRDHDRDRDNDRDHDPNCDCDHDHDHARAHDREHDCDPDHAPDRDRERLKPVRKIAAFISQYPAGVCLPAIRKHQR